MNLVIGWLNVDSDHRVPVGAPRFPVTAFSPINIAVFSFDSGAGFLEAVRKEACRSQPKECAWLIRYQGAAFQIL